MLLIVFWSLIAIQAPLLATAAPNLKTCTENGRPTPDVSSPDSSLMQVDSTYRSDTLTSSTSCASSPPSTAASWHQSLHHGSVGSVNSGESAFRGSRTGSPFGYTNPSHHSKAWNASLSSLRATVTVSNCSQFLWQSTPEPKCICPHLPTSTIVITVTATIYPSDASPSDARSQTLPPVPASPLYTVLESSLGASPMPRLSSSQASIVLSDTTSRSAHCSTEQASSRKFETLSAPSLNYPQGPIRFTRNTSPSKPTKSILALYTDDRSFGFISKPASPVSSGTARNASTAPRPCLKMTGPTLQSSLPSENLKTSQAHSKGNPINTEVSTETLKGSKFGHLLRPTPSAPAQSASKDDAGSATLEQTPSLGQVSQASAYGYSSDIATPSVTSDSNTGVPSPYSIPDASLQSSLIQHSSDQLPSSQSLPYNVPMSPIMTSVPFLTTPLIPISSTNLPFVISSPPIETSTSVLPSAAVVPLSTGLLLNSPVLTASLMPSKPNGAPYANTSQAMNLTSFSYSTGSPNPSYQLTLPTNGPHTSSRPYNGSLHTIMCFPNTTSITHILANVRLAPFDSPL